MFHGLVDHLPVTVAKFPASLYGHRSRWVEMELNLMFADRDLNAGRCVKMSKIEINRNAIQG